VLVELLTILADCVARKLNGLTLTPSQEVDAYIPENTSRSSFAFFEVAKAGDKPNELRMRK